MLAGLKKWAAFALQMLLYCVAFLIKVFGWFLSLPSLALLGFAKIFAAAGDHIGESAK